MVKKQELDIAKSVNAQNASIMPMQTRRLVHQRRTHAGERWQRMEASFKRAAEVSHTRSINRPSKPQYDKAAGMGNAFPALVRQ